MEPIICSEPLDLVHIDYVSMEVMAGIKEKPVMKNVLVVEAPLYMLYPSIYHEEPYSVHHGKGFVQRILLGVQVPTLTHV